MKLILVVLILINSHLAQAQYGNPYGNDTNSHKIYDANGNYRGNLNDNKYDSNSVSNPYGRYGSKYSSESINNPYNNPSYQAPRRRQPSGW